MSNRALVSGSETRPVLANAQMLGGLSLNQSGSFVSLAVSGSDNSDKTVSFASKSAVLLSSSFAGVSGSLIQSLNYLQAVASAGSGDVSAGTIDADNNVAFWSSKSNKTIAGDNDLTFDGADLTFGASTAGSVNFQTTTTTINGTGVLSVDSAGAASHIKHSAAVDGDFTISMDESVDASLILSSAGTAADALQVTSTAGGMDLTSALAMDISSTAGAVNVEVVDGQSVSIGKASAAQMVITPHGTAGSEKISVTNTAGSADDAVKFVATAGGMDIDAGGSVDIASTSGSINVQVADGQSVSVGKASSAQLVLTPHGTAGSEKISLTNTAGSADDAVKLISTAGGMDIDAGGLVDIASTSGSINVAVVDGQSVSIGKASAAQLVLTPHATAGSEVITLINTAGSADNAVRFQAAAGGMDIDAGGKVSIESASGSINIGSALADSQELSLGNSASTSITLTPSNIAASELVGVVNTAGTNTGADGQAAISLGAQAGGITLTAGANSNRALEIMASAGGIWAGVDASGDYGEDAYEGFNIGNAAANATYAFVNDKGATFPVARSAGYAVNASGTLAVGGTDLALGADTRFLAMSAFPTIGMLGVSESGALRQYYLQVSGGILQVQQG